MSIKLPMDKLIPPDDPLRSWRWIIAFAVIFLLLNAGSARGLLFSGIGAFAYAEDVKDNGKKIDNILTLQLAQAMRDLRREECRSNGNKDVIRSTIEQYQQQYVAITKTRYPLPPCENV